MLLDTAAVSYSVYPIHAWSRGVPAVLIFCWVWKQADLIWLTSSLTVLLFLWPDEVKAWSPHQRGGLHNWPPAVHRVGCIACQVWALPASLWIVGITSEFYGYVLFATSAYCNSLLKVVPGALWSVLEMSTGSQNFITCVSLKPLVKLWFLWVFLPDDGYMGCCRAMSKCL